jgi:cytochrome c oxidase subunit I+III
VIGGLTGVMVGVVPFDWQAHDSYFVVAHFHYVLIGGVIFPLFAGLYYWLPKITGRLMSERLGKWNFWLMFVFFNVAFFPMHISGILGMPRRVYTYPEGVGLETTNLISTIGAFGFATGLLLLVVNFLWSLRRGAPAGKDPWHGDSLEWSEESPPPAAQFIKLPVVRSRHPMWEQNTLEPEDQALARQFDDLDARPADWRGAVVTSVLDAKPLALVHVPGPTIVPFVMAVGFVFLFAGALTEETIVLAIGALITAVSIVGWFRPQQSEKRALEEIGTAPREEGRLPLAVAGPTSNGWWGTIVLLMVLATALVTIVASYYYLGEGPGSWTVEAPTRLLEPLLATLLTLGVAGSAGWFVRSIKRGNRRHRGLGVVAAFVLSVLSLWLGTRSFTQTGLEPEYSAYASAFVGMLGFQWLVLLLLIVWLMVALLWIWRSPEDPRGDGAAYNASLIAYFAGISGVVAFVVLYLTPRVL